MRRDFGFALFVLCLTYAVPSVRAQEKDHASWWVTNYGVVDPARVPNAVRAERIFDRLAATADKRANRMSRLAILDANGTPFAMALPDGTVLLTKGALRITYGGVSREVGDARMAFVIGHELSHLGNDDFWHAAAFDALSKPPASPPFDAVRVLFAGNAEEAQRRELQADAFGMLYMTMAGYDPREILKGKSFFEEWAAELDALQIRTTGALVSPGQRAFFVRAQLNRIADEIDFFYFGVRLVQLGRFQDGLLLLEKFRDRFPSREVLNNIGVAHYQLAARFLGNCDGSLITRFMLPVRLDSQTRAARLRGGQRSGCFANERFQLHFREAERNLVQASEMDPAYAPSRLNLLALYALTLDGSRALVVSDEVRELLPDDARARSGSAVALFLYGEQSALEMADTAIEKLQALHHSHPESAEAAYNLGAMLAERRRVQAAEKAYRAFLELEPTGVYAGVARDYVGEPPASDRADAALPVPEPPLPLGPLAETRRSIPDARIQEFVIGDFNGSFVSFAGGRALAIDDTVELIERELGDLDLDVDLSAAAETQASTTEHLSFFRNVVVVSRDGHPASLLYTSAR